MLFRSGEHGAENEERGVGNLLACSHIVIGHALGQDLRHEGVMVKPDGQRRDHPPKREERESDRVSPVAGIAGEPAHELREGRAANDQDERKHEVARRGAQQGEEHPHDEDSEGLSHTSAQKHERHATYDGGKSGKQHPNQRVNARHDHRYHRDGNVEGEEYADSDEVSSSKAASPPQRGGTSCCFSHFTPFARIPTWSTRAVLDNTYSIMIGFAGKCASPIGAKVYRSAREVALLLFTVRPVMSSQTVASDPICGPVEADEQLNIKKRYL